MQIKRFVKVGLVVLLGVSFYGCTTKYHYQSQTLTDSSNKYKIDISMKKVIEQGLLLSHVKNVVTVYINDEIALKGSLERDESGELQSTYDGKKLTLECDKNNIFSKTTCLVHLGQKRMGNFELNMK